MTATSTCRRSTGSTSSSATSTTSTRRRSRSTRTTRSPKRFPNFRDRFGPRGVLHTWATDEDDATEDPRFGRVGKQRIEDTGPLTKKRMETVDEEFLDGAMDFIDRAHADDKPFFVWWNSTRMHVFTHLKAESKGVTGLGVYPDGMVEHDGHVGQFLDKLDELGIADDTIVVYSTDNGAEVMTWPDGGATPFRGEKATNWEGGFRVPMVIRWPGVIEPGTINNEICAHEDLIPTFVAAAGDPDIVEKCLSGPHRRRQDLQGPPRRLQPAAGRSRTPPPTHEWPRKLFPYWGDDGEFLALRYEQWKVVFQEQRAHGLARLGGAVRRAARAAHVQHPVGSVRARTRGHLLRHLQGRAPVHRRAGRGPGGRVADDLPRVPAADEAGVVQPRPGDGAGDQRRPGRTDGGATCLSLERHDRRRPPSRPSSSGSPAVRMPSRSKSGSRSSTTTGRSGPRSRCRSSSCSSSSAGSRWPRPTRRFAIVSRGRRRSNATTPSSAGPSTSTTPATTSDVKVLHGRRHRGVRRAWRSRPTAPPPRRSSGTSHHPTLKRPFRGVGYQPMVELLRYLEANGFTTFIASGGNRDFMRGFAADIYGIPPERIVGSSNELTWVEDGDGSVVYAAAPDVFDDGPAKPIRIWSRIGRRPLVAGGNSNGDIPMLALRRDDRPAGPATARPPRRRRARVRLRQGRGDGARARHVPKGGPSSA